ncbi:MAG TPA: PilZ domain-containing protein [Terriglobales bacterium]|nr:PilZ domain-containing protein [Terriglobales bacterium]
MEFTPDLATARAPTAEHLRQRRFLRQKVQNLAYVNLDRENGGIIRDVSERGIAVQTVSALKVDDQLPVRFELLGPRARVETTGRVAWTDPLGQAGMEFCEIPPRARQQIKDWIFTQLLASASRASGLESVFVHHRGGQDAAELLISGEPRASIAVVQDPAASDEELQYARVTLFGSSFSISALLLSRAVDSLILLCAVLLFVLISSVISDTFPSWPVALALVLCVTTIFAGVYWAMFTACVGGTVGDDIARLASGSPCSQEEDQPRFR